MTTVEVRPSGAKIIRHDPGEQPLLVASPHKQEFVWLTPLKEVILLRRHWNNATDSTEPCLCNPTCGSSRVDRCVATIVKLNGVTYDERLLLLPEEGWRSFERAWLLRDVHQPDPLGARCHIQRTGSRRNGRTVCQPQDWQPDPARSFDLVAAVRQQLHIAVDFFGTEEGPPDQGGRMIPPARSRQDKPRVPLGKSKG